MKVKQYLKEQIKNGNINHDILALTGFIYNLRNICFMHILYLPYIWEDKINYYIIELKREKAILILRKEVDKNYFQNLILNKDTEGIGKILEFPECCINYFNYKSRKPPEFVVRNEKIWTPWMPCSDNCEKSKEYTEKIKSIVDQI